MSERVDATVIETDLAKVPKAEEWLASVRERVDALASQYTPHEIVDDADRKRSRTDRASVRKDRDEIASEGKTLISEVERRVKDFKAGIKDAVSRLDEIDAEYKRHLDAEDERFRISRMEELAETYEGYAPALAEIVPLEAIVGKYGAKWANRSTSIVTAKNELADACEDIGNGEHDIDELVADEDDRRTVKAIYFSTLDLHAATTKARELREQRRRVEEMERQRTEWEAQAAEWAAQEQPDPELQPEPKPKPQPEPETAQADEACPWVVVVPSATRAQMRALADMLGGIGLKGRCIKGSFDEKTRRVV